MLESLSQNSLINKLTAHIPPAQFSRYTLVGIWNTVFGYGSYAALTALFTPRIAHAYIFAAVVASFVNITVAFLGYKWFVFKTKGNYLREWARCVVIYGGGIVIGIVLLPLFVFALRHYTRFNSSAPYIGGAALTALNIIVTFVGHRNFSFAGARHSSS